MNKTTLRDVAQRFGVSPWTVFTHNGYIMNYLIHIAPKVIRLPDNNEAEAKAFEEVQ